MAYFHAPPQTRGNADEINTFMELVGGGSDLKSGTERLQKPRNGTRDYGKNCGLFAARSREHGERAMSVFRDPRSPYWQYNFQIGGHRYHGSTKARTERDAESVERVVRERVIRGKEPKPQRPRGASQKWIKRRDSDEAMPLVGVYLLMLKGERSTTG